VRQHGEHDQPDERGNGHLGALIAQERRGTLASFTAGLVALLGAAAAPGGDRSPPEPLRYDRDVRPLLSDRCFRCHGPDPKQRKADLRLDSAAEATADLGGYAAIVPGNVQASELVHRITSPDDDIRMPPSKSGRRRLSEDEAGILRRWVEEGARYEPHWSFVPPVRPPLPEVRDAAWPANPVDRFVLARLEKEGFAPSPDADPAALCRRLFLDLTGLPPTIEELDAFLADARPDRLERLTDRLLTSEPYVSRYAERMASPWLDAARYADTCGIHMDAGRQIWPWRDWVLAAFRDGMPFDRFLTEQLAGDLLPDATEASKVASGFNRNHVTTDEGGAIAEEYLVEYAVDRAATTSTVFLGLTMGCARCHEHKFDPVSQEEFYSFYAFFDSIEEPGLYSQLPDPNRAFEPFLRVPRPEQQSELDEIARDVGAEKTVLEAPVPGEDAQRAAFLSGAVQRSGISWETAALVSAASSGGAAIALQPDGSALASGANPEKDDHDLVLRTDAEGLRLLLVEALPDPSLPQGRVGRSPNGNAVLTGVRAEAVSIADPSRRAPVRFVWAWADVEQTDGDFRAVNVLDADDDRGWAVDAHRTPGGRAALLSRRSRSGTRAGPSSACDSSTARSTRSTPSAASAWPSGGSARRGSTCCPSRRARGRSSVRSRRRRRRRSTRPRTGPRRGPTSTSRGTSAPGTSSGSPIPRSRTARRTTACPRVSARPSSGVGCTRPARASWARCSPRTTASASSTPASRSRGRRSTAR
jgi:hypothetical protein